MKKSIVYLLGFSILLGGCSSNPAKNVEISKSIGIVTDINNCYRCTSTLEFTFPISNNAYSTGQIPINDALGKMNVGDKATIYYDKNNHANGDYLISVDTKNTELEYVKEQTKD